MPRLPRPFRPVIVRYHLPDGSRCKKGTPGAVRSECPTETYYAKLGKDKVSLETTDEGQAWERLRQLLRRRAEGRAGLRDEFTDAAEAPLTRHVEDYAAVLLAKGDGEGYVATVRADVLRVAAEAGWKSIADLTADSCLLAISRLAKRHNLNPTTRNHVLSHCKQFARWLSRPAVGRLRGNPLDSPDLTKLPEDTDRRHDRRPPTDAEIAALMTYLHGPHAKRRRGMTGPTRALGYRVCMATGFRAGELRSLSPANFDLDRGTVTVVGAYSKNRRRDTQQLPPWLVAELREFFAAGGTGWNFPAKSPGRILYPDLLAAGVPISVLSPSGPLFFDFPAMRTFFLTWAGSHPGISPKALQSLARHSSPVLTLKVYSKVKVDEVRRIMDSMPPPGEGQPQQAAETVLPPVAPAPEISGNRGESPETMDTPERAKGKAKKDRNKGRADDAKG